MIFLRIALHYTGVLKRRGPRDLHLYRSVSGGLCLLPGYDICVFFLVARNCSLDFVLFLGLVACTSRRGLATYLRFWNGLDQRTNFFLHLERSLREMIPQTPITYLCTNESDFGEAENTR